MGSFRGGGLCNIVEFDGTGQQVQATASAMLYLIGLVYQIMLPTIPLSVALLLPLWTKLRAKLANRSSSVLLVLLFLRLVVVVPFLLLVPTIGVEFLYQS